MKRATILSVVFMLASALMTISAQYVTWSVRPVYDNIEQCADNLYTVTKNRHVGIINATGKVIVPIEADKITGFYRGYALVLEEKKGKNLVLGIVSAEGVYTEMSTACYAIPSIDFVSEGFLAVEFPDGKRGFMNTNGTVAQKFDKSITNLLPFSEGFAVIGKGRDSQLVDKDFNEILVQIPGGVLNRIFSVCNGVAMVLNNERHLYEFDIRTRLPNHVGQIKTNQIENDYLGAVKSTRPKTVPYDLVRTGGALSSIAAVKQGGKYGFEYNGKDFVPCQFDYASPFYNSHAIVKLDNKYGVLAFHNGSLSFAASPVDNGKISYKRGKGSKLSHGFSLVSPSELGSDFRLSLISPDDSKINVTGNGKGQYEFLADAVSGQRNYTVEVSDNGLTLWRGTLTYQYHIIEEPKILTPPGSQDNQGGKEVQKKKEELKKLSIEIGGIENTQAGYKATVTVRNPNTTAVSTTVTVEGKGLENIKISPQKSVSVPANSSIRLYISFTVPKAARYKITVTETTTKAKNRTEKDLRPR